MRMNSEQCSHGSLAKRRKVPKISFCNLPMSSLSYIVTGFPSSSPRVETLTLLSYEREKTMVPVGPFKFTYLQNLRLELVISDYDIRKTDVLDYAYLLKIAPFMETLELAHI
nr:unnamed protein product [Digitaria exilis]